MKAHKPNPARDAAQALARQISKLSDQDRAGRAGGLGIITIMGVVMFAIAYFTAAMI